ncbi:MAG: acyl-CoA thioesterase domain-containing protein [Acidimicrobiia bacterium]
MSNEPTTTPAAGNADGASATSGTFQASATSEAPAAWPAFMMQSPADLLDVEAIDVDLFIAPAMLHIDASRLPPRARLFGGQVAGQSLKAAANTVEGDRPVHSLHCYFLRPGNPTLDLLFYVNRSRDGGSFTTRHVRARQGGETIFELIASFHRPEPSDERALPAAEVPSAEEVAAAAAPPSPAPPNPGDWFDMHEVPSEGDAGAHLDQSVLRYWIRIKEQLADDPSLHAALLAYMSDLRAGSAPMRAVGIDGPAPDMGVQVASLDHAMWFHRPMRADGWLLMEVRPAAVSGSRSLVLGTIHDAAGLHGVSFTQELLLRRARPTR